MTTIDLTKTVRDFAVELPEATRVFEKLGIDYCCGGDKTLRDACLASGVSPDKVVGLLEESRHEAADSDESINWNSAPLSDLAAYIVNKHHRFTREELLRLRELLAKVCSVHGENHAELHRLRIVFTGLQDELTSHMLKEEQILFPYIQNLEFAIAHGKPAPRPLFGTVRNPIRMMIQEHDDAGQALRALREASSNYRVPADGCMSFHTLYQALEEFEKDLHQHIHLENNILFPRAAELEECS
jgi:regulator of cell morphogenesis and NO signaling